MKVSHRISTNGSVQQEAKALQSKFRPNNTLSCCNFLTKDFLSHFTSYLHIPFTRTGSPQVNNSLFHRLLQKEDDKCKEGTLYFDNVELCSISIKLLHEFKYSLLK